MLSRRSLLGLLAPLPIVGGAVAARRAVAAIGRPAAVGTSGTRCAQCGADDHTMLAAGCPSAPRVV